MNNTFGAYHPVVGFGFFFSVVVFTVLFTNPVMAGISFFVSLIYAVYLKGGRAVLSKMKFLLPAALMAALINPLVNHRGANILFYTFSGNPVTLESVLYGLLTGVMLMSVFLWFSCYGEIMTSDKFIYMFGKPLPALSLIITMTLCFVPRFGIRLRQISTAQRCLGQETRGTGKIRRAKEAMMILSAMTTWALENSIETADSMKARGFGLPGRTSFSLYTFTRRDAYVLALIILFSVIVIAAAAAGVSGIEFYPVLRTADFSFMYGSACVLYGMLCALPLILEGLEQLKWTYFRLKI
jgi:energy-coupling factor transport system permease protein